MGKLLRSQTEQKGGGLRTGRHGWPGAHRLVAGAHGRATGGSLEGTGAGAGSFI